MIESDIIKEDNTEQGQVQSSENGDGSSSTQNDKMMFERFKLIEELIATEFIYVNDLRIITEVFMNNIQSQDIISHDEFNAIFSNINNILECNKSLYSELRQAIGTKDIDKAGEKLGSVFLKFAEFLKMYQLYCQNRPNSIETQKRLMKSSKKFSHFIEETLLNERVNQQPLDSFLVKPVQRICRYPLLIHGILKNTPKDHPDYDILNTTLQKLQNITDVVNEYTRKKDSENKLFQLDLKITGYDGMLSEVGRNLILESTIQVALSKDDAYEAKLIVLTNDMILVLKPKKKKLSFKKKILLHSNLIVEPFIQEFKLKVHDDENSLYLKFDGIADFEIWTKAIQNEITELKAKKMNTFKPQMRKKRSSSSVADLKRKKDLKSDDLSKKSSRKSIEFKSSPSFQKLQEMINDSEQLSKSKSNEKVSKDDSTPTRSPTSKRGQMKRSISASNIKSTLITRKDEKLESPTKNLINDKTETCKLKKSMSVKDNDIKEDKPTIKRSSSMNIKDVENLTILKEKKKEKKRRHSKARSVLLREIITEKDESEEDIISSECSEDSKTKINTLIKENEQLKKENVKIKNELEKMNEFKVSVLSILDMMDDQIKALRKQLENV